MNLLYIIYVRTIIIVMNIFASILGHKEYMKLLSIIHMNIIKYIMISMTSAWCIDSIFSVVSCVKFLRKWRYEFITIPVIKIYPDIIITILSILDIKNAIVIEDKKYLVFKKQGELPMVVVELWEEIWDYFEKNSEYARAFEVDFEKYAKEDEIEIFVSIK